MENEDGTITAPWTPEQVEQLNRFQRGGYFHLFTCVNDHEADRDLVATTEGWVCPSCNYTQNWAHGFMANKENMDLADAGIF